MGEVKRICVFCGSSSGNHPIYTKTARDLGRLLVQQNIGLVYGGASIGMMGAVADSVIENGGEAIGVMPKFLVNKEIAHKQLAELRIVESMHNRKELMSDLSDGFIALPGGLGTLEEFFEVLTWAQLRIHKKPCGLLNVSNFFRKLIEFLDHAASEKFVKIQHKSMILIDDSPEGLLNKFKDYRPPQVDKLLHLKV